MRVNVLLCVMSVVGLARMAFGDAAAVQEGPAGRGADAHHDMSPEGAQLPPSLDWRPIPLDDPEQGHYAYWFDFVKQGERRARGEADEMMGDILPPGEYFPPVQVFGEGLRLIVPRAFARPGDRWVEVFVEVDSALLASNASVSLEASLFAPGEARAVAHRRIAPDTRAGLLRVDLRRDALGQARLQVILASADEQVGVAEVFLSAQPPAETLKPDTRIAVSVDVPDGVADDEAVPVTFGVPMPAGALWQPEPVRLVTDAGADVPFQSEVVGRWAEEGAVKWLRFDAVAVPREGLNVVVGAPSAEATPAQPLALTESPDGELTLDTGTARYRLAKGPSPIGGIWRQGRQIAGAEGALGLYVVDQQGRLGQADAEGQTMVVESAGPVAACVRFEGYYRTESGEQLARHITRVEVFAGLEQAMVTHTLVLSRDTDEIWFREVGWELAVMPGDAPRVRFGISHADAEDALTHPLPGPRDAAWIVQTEHLRFGAGENRFAVGAAAAEGDSILHEGEEMGDCAALFGEGGGVMAAVRDAALQHPKEFEARPDRLNIRLFSNRAGEELDFRAQTLVDKWHLPEEWDGNVVRERVAEYETNAIGWAKTHTLMVSPLAADAPPERSVRLARLNAGSVYGHVAPDWIYQTRAMGPLHPKDPERYPGAEATVDRLVETFARHLRGTAFFGFVDYNAGPSFSPRGSVGNLVRERRFGATYQLRPDLWKLYARSGERFVRSFAEQTTRAFSDNYMAHWDGPNKRRGLFLEGRMGSREPFLGPGDLPFYWDGRTVFNFEYHGDVMSLNHIVYDYFLSGNRRAGDIARQYALAVTRDWTPETAARYVRTPMTFRGLLHAYNLTLDPTLRVMAEATLSFLYDPEGQTGMTKNKQLGATYKARCAVRALIEGWDTFGTPMHYDMARRLSAHKWPRYLPLGGTTSPYAIMGNFLYRETGSPHYAQWMDFFLRHAAVREVSTGGFRAADISSGIAQAQDAMTRFDPETRRRVAWVAYRDDTASRPLRVAVSKGAYDVLDVHLTTKAPRPADAATWVQPLDPPAFYVSRDRSLISMHSSSNLPPNPHGHVTMKVNIPKEAPGEAYALNPQHYGNQYVTAVLTQPEILQLSPPTRRWTQDYEWQGHVSMVLCAPEEWQTLPGPPDAKAFFKLPDDVAGAEVYVSEPTAFFTPAGEPFADGELLDGWVALPADQPGLWSFGLGGEPKTVKVRNLPPFFSFDDPVHYFEPPIPWVEWGSPMAESVTAGETIPINFLIHSTNDEVVETVKVYLDADPLYEGREAPADLVLDTAGLDPGRYTLRAVAGGDDLKETSVRVISVAAK